MKVKLDFLRFGTFSIKDGSQIRFWEDIWLGNSPLREQYPCLYNIVKNKQDTVAEVLQTFPPKISFRRDLIGQNLVAWDAVLSQTANIVLTHEQDEFRWNLTSSGMFSVKSHYLALVHCDIPNINNQLWKLKVPLKVRIFLWYLCQGVVLTKDNLAKRNWQGSTRCCFCHHEETIKHLFFDCRLARTVWSIIQSASGLFPTTLCISYV